jgi:CheY-like chemotaxis protein
MGLQESEIQSFNDGALALEHIKQYGSNLIFCDINMPKMDGFEFTERLLKMNPDFVRHLFIVTADERNGDISRMRKLGAKKFIHKPINATLFNHFVSPYIQKNSIISKIPLTNQNVISIDIERLAETIGVKAKHIPMLLNSFFSEAEMKIHSLENASVNMCFIELEHIAHFLKGSCGNLHLNEFYQRFRSMESAAHLHDQTYPYLNCTYQFKEWLIANKQTIVVNV